MLRGEARRECWSLRIVRCKGGGGRNRNRVGSRRRSREPQTKRGEIDVDSLVIEYICGTAVGIAKVPGNVGLFDGLDGVIVEQFPNTSSLDYGNIVAVMRATGKKGQS